MEKINLVSKTFLFITILFFSLFLGGYVARQIVVYQLFEPTGTNFKSIYNEQNLYTVYFTIFPIIVLNMVTYAVFLFSFLIFIITSKIKIKYEGWLFAITIILLVTAPFEIYLLTTDYKITKLIMAETMQINAISELIKARMTELSSFSLIEIFSLIAIIFIGLFKPLRKINEN
ncbi:MAG: hypothetical protein NTX65_01280 [Ignavibacteriales bacterium]|nr:hypothetical protein [Ignavibacteriales bacterium]